MKRIALLAALALAACGKTETGGYAGYDPSSDPAIAVSNALTRARAEGKRVLIEAGGNWCEWCGMLHRFYEANPPLTALRDKNFVVVKVHVEPKGPVPGALRKFPAPDKLPHLYVLDENGTLIQSQKTAELEKGDVYDAEKLAFFLKAFGPPKP